MDCLEKWGITLVPRNNNLANQTRTDCVGNGKLQHITERCSNSGFPCAPTSTCIEAPNTCGLIIGLADKDVPMFLDFARNALQKGAFYGRVAYDEGVLLVYDMLVWEKDNPDVQRLVNFLQLLADLGKPVAFVRWGGLFESWANAEGYRIFRGKIQRDPKTRNIFFAP